MAETDCVLCFSNNEGVGGDSPYNKAICPPGFAQFIDVCTVLTTPSPANYQGAEAGCAAGGNRLLIFKSWFVNAAFIQWQATQPSQQSFWVGRYEEVSQYPVTTAEMWVEGGQEVEEECVMADKENNYKWTRVSCSASASYFCEPVSADCPEGFSSIPALLLGE